MEDKEKYGNQCESDNAFTRKARLLQSMYRVEIVKRKDSDQQKPPSENTGI